MRKIEINDLAHTGINSNIKKVADITNDYPKEEKMKPFEKVLCVILALAVLWGLLSLLAGRPLLPAFVLAAVSIFPPGLTETVTSTSKFENVYSVQVNGHCVEVLEIDYKGRDYSMRVDGLDVFAGWREGPARRMVEKVLQRLSG